MFNFTEMIEIHSNYTSNKLKDHLSKSIYLSFDECIMHKNFVIYETSKISNHNLNTRNMTLNQVYYIEFSITFNNDTLLKSVHS